MEQSALLPRVPEHEVPLGVTSSLWVWRILTRLLGDHVLWSHWLGQRPVALGDSTRVGVLWLEEHDVFGSDDHVCALSFMGLRNDDGQVSTRVVSVFHYRDGRQHERWIYPEDPATWDQLMAEQPLHPLFGLARTGHTDTKGRPGPLQLAMFGREFADIVQFKSPPVALQRAMFAALSPLAHAMGSRATYPQFSRTTLAPRD